MSSPRRSAPWGSCCPRSPSPRRRAAQSTEPFALRCRGTFQVLHNDRVGALRLPAGAYAIGTENLSCAQAAKLLGQFLQDWDGRLAKPWKIVTARREFTRGSADTDQKFTVTPAPKPKPPNAAPGGACPYFTVLRADRIGPLRLPAGRYRVGLLGRGLSCDAAARSFYEFLFDASGALPAPWRLTLNGTAAGAFRDGTSGSGFTVQRAFASTEGGGTYPAQGQYFCPGTFVVQNDDPVGKLLVKKGRYRITVFGSVDCPLAVRVLPGFLGERDGVLVSPWKLRVETGSFTRGTGTANGFRIEPALR